MCLLDHFMFFLMLKVAFNKLSAISTLIVMELLPILKVFWVLVSFPFIHFLDKPLAVSEPDCCC